MDNHGEDEVEGVWQVMIDLYTHTYPHTPTVITHSLYMANPRGEQGFYNLSTDKGASYYDYLYIHTSSYTNNLSTNKTPLEKLKSRG